MQGLWAYTTPSLFKRNNLDNPPIQTSRVRKSSKELETKGLLLMLKDWDYKLPSPLMAMKKLSLS